LAGSTATCAGSFDCDIIGGYLGVYPGTSVTGNFAGDTSSTADTAGCAADGLAAWKVGTAMTNGKTMLAEMGGVTFTPGVYTHESSINIAATNPEVYLDAKGDARAVFIFNAGTTLTTSAKSRIVLLNGAKKENVFWILGTALTMGADSILVGNVLAGSAITIGTNAKIVGRAIAQTAVTCETACTIETSGRHSAAPSADPSASPSSSPSSAPSASPSTEPTASPSAVPSAPPIAAPQPGCSLGPMAGRSDGPTKITGVGEAYGHHGQCDGFNGCNDAATCALAACKVRGYTELVSYGEAKPCTEFNVCHLFNNLSANTCDVDCNWGNGCRVAGVTDIVCKNPGDECSA
jgi:hypothetical protein